MGEKCNTITLYASQADPVIEAIERNGVCYSKEAYVRKYVKHKPLDDMLQEWSEASQFILAMDTWFERLMAD